MQPLATTTERSRKAESEFQRRMARRSCGHCGAPAETMLEWDRQRVAICGECRDRLDQPGFRCLLGDYPCEDCIVPPPVEARVVDAELAAPGTWIAVFDHTPGAMTSALVRVVSAIKTLFRTGRKP